MFVKDGEKITNRRVHWFVYANANENNICKTGEVNV